MPEYSNPEVADGINVSHSHPLADFARLLAGITLVVAGVVLVLALTAGYLAKTIPFATEVAVASRFSGQLDKGGSAPVVSYLRDLTSKLAAAHDLPPGMTITVHYLPEDTVNAFATLGGHVAVYEGLVRRMQNENALAMVISHEIAHVKHRHPIASMGRGIVVGAAIAAIASSAGADIVGQALGPAGLLTVTGFSRAQEREADAAGLEAVVKVYGHANGAADTFVTLKEATADMARPPAWLSTHPLDDERIATISDITRRRGWPEAGALKPYPEAVKTALSIPPPAAPSP